MVHGRLVPGGDCAAILSNLPSGVQSIDDVLQNHTLLPYYTRFFPTDKKRQVWEALRVGRGSGITSVRTQMPDGVEGLKYCPTCYLLDTEKYGEAYWHRVHQIPLLGYCPMHKIPLVTLPIKFSRLSEVFLPLGSVHCQETVTEGTEPSIELLTDILAALLYGDYAPTVGYNNLHTALINAGYGVDKISEHQALSAAKIQQAAREYYGTQIYEQYFASLSAAVLSRLAKWQLSSPERYALLAVMVGMDADTLFGLAIEPIDPLLEKLLSYKEAGVIYGKSDLAAKMGIQPGQLDSLAQKYNIQPFWRQIRQDRCKCIRLLLTNGEYELILKAARESGNTQLAVYVRTIVLDVLCNKEESKCDQKSTGKL